MTRDKFIDDYVNRSFERGGYRLERTSDGFVAGDRRRVALPCACGDESCAGWAMVNADPEDIETHNRLYALAARDQSQGGEG